MRMLENMFDFQFKKFITLQLISLLYLLGLAAIIAGAVMQITAQYQFQVLDGFSTAVIIGGSLVSALILRVILELVAVLFRIAENTSQIAGRS